MDNSVGNNFRLMRIFLYAASLLPENERNVFEKGRVDDGAADGEDESEEDEEPPIMVRDGDCMSREAWSRSGRNVIETPS